MTELGTSMQANDRDNECHSNTDESTTQAEHQKICSRTLDVMIRGTTEGGVVTACLLAAEPHKKTGRRCNLTNSLMSLPSTFFDTVEGSTMIKTFQSEVVMVRKPEPTYQVASQTEQDTPSPNFTKYTNSVPPEKLSKSHDGIPTHMVPSSVKHTLQIPTTDGFGNVPPLYTFGDPATYSLKLQSQMRTAKQKSRWLNRPKWLSISLQIAVYVTFLCVIYFALVGWPLWHGAIYTFWWST